MLNERVTKNSSNSPINIPWLLPIKSFRNVITRFPAFRKRCYCFNLDSRPDACIIINCWDIGSLLLIHGKYFRNFHLFQFSINIFQKRLLCY